MASHTPPITDNDMVFTTRLAGDRGGSNRFEAELHRLGVRQINSTPNYPTTCEKGERLHQTFNRWLLKASTEQVGMGYGPLSWERTLDPQSSP